MRINTNVAANNAYRNLSVTNTMVERSIQRLSSGFRINRAADDSSGMAIANTLRAQGRSLQAAQRNAQQGSAMLQIADGAVNTIAGILDRLKELATASNSAAVGSNERNSLNQEFEQLVQEIDRITATTTFQGTRLIDGTFGGGSVLDTDPTASSVFGVAGVSRVTVSSSTAAGTYSLSSSGGDLTVEDADGNQVVLTGVGDGAQTINVTQFGITISLNSGYSEDDLDGTDIVVAASTTGASFQVSSSGAYDTDDRVSLGSINATTTALGLTGLAVDTEAGAVAALSAIDDAITQLNTVIGTLGAAQSRFDVAIANVSTIYQNVVAAESTIRDADIAFETTQFTKAQILQQAGTAMLAQANQSSQNVLSLLRG